MRVRRIKHVSKSLRLKAVRKQESDYFDSSRLTDSTANENIPKKDYKSEKLFSDNSAINENQCDYGPWATIDPSCLSNFSEV